MYFSVILSDQHPDYNSETTLVKESGCLDHEYYLSKYGDNPKYVIIEGKPEGNSSAYRPLNEAEGFLQSLFDNTDMTAKVAFISIFPQIILAVKASNFTLALALAKSVSAAPNSSTDGLKQDIIEKVYSLIQSMEE